MRRSRGPLVTVLAFVLVALGLVVAMPRPARAFGDVGAFDPRILVVSGVPGAAGAGGPPRGGGGGGAERTGAPQANAGPRR